MPRYRTVGSYEPDTWLSKEEEEEECPPKRRPARDPIRILQPRRQVVAGTSQLTWITR